MDGLRNTQDVDGNMEHNLGNTQNGHDIVDRIEGENIDNHDTQLICSAVEHDGK